MLESTMLVVSDDPSFVESVDDLVRSIGDLKVVALPAVEAAYSYGSWDHVALVLIHLRRRDPSTEAARLLRMIAAARRPVATLVVGEKLDDHQASTLLRLGAADYLSRPLDVARLSYLVEVLTVRARNGSPAMLATSGEDDRRIDPGDSDPIFDDVTQDSDLLMSQVRRVAPQGTTILLSGETGTGKTRLAHLIHELSPRHDQPFLVINCGALSASQVEGEMFGHAPGSFDGTERDRRGKFAEVGRGTLFLDEIDCLPMTVQSKLLRVVEDRKFEVTGSGASMPVRARLIAASNRALEQEVVSQRFRSDLYYRLNVIGFHLPPLRERRGVISALVSKFITESAARNGVKVTSIEGDALRALEEYDWPGNIRELKNMIERAVTLCPGPEVRLKDLPDSITKTGQNSKPHRVYIPATIPVPAMASSTLAEIKRDAELARITEALEKHSNNRLRAASELGISRMTLYKKLYKYGLMQPSAASRGGVA
jgi:DNA-binding NtrC family response regulator